MQTHHITRFVARFFKFILTLLTLLIAQFLLTAILIQMLKRSKKFRAKFFKLVNPPTLYLAGRRFSPFVLLTALLWE